MKKKALTLCLCVMFGLLCLLPARAEDDDTLTGDTVLAADTEYGETRSVSGTATLDLQGHTLKFTGTGSVFQVKSGGTLTITDSSAEKTGVITGGNVLESTTPMISNGSFGGGAFVNDRSSGGGVYVAAGGKLVLTGGTITGNHALYGGGVYLESGASLEVSGSASVTGNDTGEERDEVSGEVSGQPSNVWLPLDENQTQSVITVADALDSGAVIGVSAAGAPTDDTPVMITSGLSGKGGLSNFTSDDAAYSIRLNDGGEAELMYSPIPYTVKAADKDETAGKKYQYGETVTVAVSVSSEDGEGCEGAEFTLNYDSEMFELKEEQVAPLVQTGENEEPPKNTRTNTTSSGVYNFSLNNNVVLSSGEPLVYLTFKVIQYVKEDTTCEFAFEGTPKICYDLNRNTIAAQNVENGSVIVTPTLYNVTLVTSSGEFDPGGFTLTGDNGAASIDNGKAIAGFDYVVTIAPYDADNYAYPIDLKVNDTLVGSENTPTPGGNGRLTIPKAIITGDINLTVTRTLTNFDVTVAEDYVSGWTLVKVMKTEENKKDPIYTYSGKQMYYLEASNAYALLIPGPKSGVEGGRTVTQEEAKKVVALGTETAGRIPAGYDVNATGQVDYSDALLAYRCYVLGYDLSDMETYLRANVNNDQKADTGDVTAINAARKGSG